MAGAVRPPPGFLAQPCLCLPLTTAGKQRQLPNIQKSITCRKSIKKGVAGAGDAAQRWDTCLVGARPWIESPAPQREDRRTPHSAQKLRSGEIPHRVIPDTDVSWRSRIGGVWNLLSVTERDTVKPHGPLEVWGHAWQHFYLTPPMLAHHPLAHCASLREGLPSRSPAAPRPPPSALCRAGHPAPQPCPPQPCPS